MSYVRFVIPKPDEDSGCRQGLFQALFDLQSRDELSAEEERRWTDTKEWFAKHLEVPSRFARSTNSRAQPVAISWFKSTATEHIRQMRALTAILASHGAHVEMLVTDRPGYVVYEDEHQIAATPFNDTGA